MDIESKNIKDDTVHSFLFILSQELMHNTVNELYLPHVSLQQKDDEINHQSQMVEKLKEQMLDQEEVKDHSFTSFHQFG